MSRAGPIDGGALPVAAAKAAPEKSGTRPGYFEHSRTPLVSLAFVLPLVVIYEVGTGLGRWTGAGSSASQEAPQHIIAFTLLQQFFSLLQWRIHLLGCHSHPGAHAGRILRLTRGLVSIQHPAQREIPIAVPNAVGCETFRLMQSIQTGFGFLMVGKQDQDIAFRERIVEPASHLSHLALSEFAMCDGHQVGNVGAREPLLPISELFDGVP